MGLGGRGRALGAAAERTRNTVGRAIRRAVELIAQAHPMCGEHLQKFLKLGMFCSYSPGIQSRVRWSL
jgi:hypothetical protein